MNSDYLISLGIGKNQKNFLKIANKIGYKNIKISQIDKIYLEASKKYHNILLRFATKTNWKVLKTTKKVPNTTITYKKNTKNY